MTSERKTSLVATIEAAHPFLRVNTCWCMGDFDHHGIEIHSRDAATGNTLCASLDDAELDSMSDADVAQWAHKCVEDHRGRQKRTRRAIAVERQMDRE